MGYLFSTKTKALNKSELVFFITPRIITAQMVANMQNTKQMHYRDTLDTQKENFLDKQIKDNKKDNEDKKEIKSKEEKSKKLNKSNQELHNQRVNKMFGI